MAYEIVKIYHGQEEADKAQDYFVNTFSKKELPDDIEEIVALKDETLIEFMIKANCAESKSDARRKIEQGGVSIDGEKITAASQILTQELFDGKILKVGKKNFVKIIFK